MATNLAAASIKSTGSSTSRTFGSRFAEVFNVLDYGAVGDGTTDDYTAVAAALTAIYTNKGGKLVFPFKTAGYKLGTSVVVDVAQYAAGLGITIDLGGNKILPSHTGWCFDVKTNFFGTNNGGLLGAKPVYIEGNGAVIATSNGAAAGGIRIQDCVDWAIRDLTINSYAAGDAIQLWITTNDQSTWIEFGEIANVKGSGNLQGIYAKSSNANASFLGNNIRNVAFEGRVNNCKLYNLEGLWFNAVFQNVGGYYNQLSTTGGNGFYLNGGYCGTSFITPWIDGGGGGTQSVATDIVFGANYEGATAQYQPILIGVTEIDLPVNWRSNLLVVGPTNISGALSGLAGGNPREVLRSNRTYYVNGSTGSDSNNNGLSSGAAFATIAKALSVIYGELDCAGYNVTVQLADATYTTAISVSGQPVGLGSGSLIISGNAGTPGNVIISTTSADALTVRNGARVNITGLRLQTTTGGNAINCRDTGSYVYLDTGCQFGACAAKQVFAQLGGTVELGTNYTITGNAVTHYECSNGTIIKGGNCDATSRAFSGNFANVYSGGRLLINNTTFTTTSSTGTRYYVYAQGLIQTFGAGTTIFPGNVAGSADTATYGLYA